jgi:hypothetical protein
VLIKIAKYSAFLFTRIVRAFHKLQQVLLGMLVRRQFSRYGYYFCQSGSFKISRGKLFSREGAKARCSHFVFKTANVAALSCIYDWEKPMVSLVNITYKKSYPKREKRESKFESFFSIVGFSLNLSAAAQKITTSILSNFVFISLIVRLFSETKLKSARIKKVLSFCYRAANNKYLISVS